MPKSSNQKLKLIYLMKILLERTDETHSITMPEIIDALAAYDISAERKSLYNDIENLRVYGLDVIGTQEDRTYSYHIGNRQFELAELKLLVDSVQSAKFITAKKSNEMIKKIEGFASKYEASQLQRQVFLAGRVKKKKKSINKKVENIHDAKTENKNITLQKYKDISDKDHLKKILAMPVHFLLESGKGFFVRNDEMVLGLREELRPLIDNPVMTQQMKDVIDYRTMDYYQRRYRERQNE